MDIARISMMLSQSRLQQQASLALTTKMMDQAKRNGDFVTKMMEGANVQALQRAAQPHLGGIIDMVG